MLFKCCSGNTTEVPLWAMVIYLALTLTNICLSHMYTNSTTAVSRGSRCRWNFFFFQRTKANAELPSRQSRPGTSWCPAANRRRRLFRRQCRSFPSPSKRWLPRHMRPGTRETGLGTILDCCVGPSLVFSCPGIRSTRLIFTMALALFHLQEPLRPYECLLPVLPLRIVPRTQ